MAERKIVGWFYRNGKRIPIFEKVTAIQRRELSSAEYKTAMRNSDNPNLTSAAVMGMHPDVDDKIMMSKDGIYRSGKYEDYNRAKDLGWEYEGTVSDSARKAGVFDDKPRNKGIRRDPDPKALRENIKLKGKSERASKVKDASFTTRVERDVMENPGDYGILHHEPKNNYRTNRFGKPYEDNERGGDGHWDVNRNGNPIPAIKRGEGKLRAHYQDDKAGAYYKDYNSTKDMKADIAKETKSKTTDLITTRKAKVRSAKPAESYIKSVMEDRGLTRAEAVKYIMDKRKK